MAAEYLDMQQKLEEMRKYKADLEKQLAQQETQMDEIAAKSDNDQVKKFVQLQKEKDSLIQFRDKLSTQLQMIKKAQSQQDQTEKPLDEDWVLVQPDSKGKSQQQPQGQEKL